MDQGIVALLVSIMSLIVAAVVAVFTYVGLNHKKLEFEDRYQSGLLGWHADVVQLLIRIKCMMRNENYGSKIDDLARLSALIEIGRFYFPNSVRDKHGDWKPAAYRGYRNSVLDYLVWCHDIFSNYERLGEAEGLVSTFQREFTSAVFEIILPAERLEKLQNITGKYFIRDKCYQDNATTRNYYGLQKFFATRYGTHK